MNISGLMAHSETRQPDILRLARDVFARLRKPGRPVWAAGPGIRIDDHLLRDIGMTRLGLREATLADRNELSCSTRSGRAA